MCVWPYSRFSIPEGAHILRIQPSQVHVLIVWGWSAHNCKGVLLVWTYSHTKRYTPFPSAQAWKHTDHRNSPLPKGHPLNFKVNICFFIPLFIWQSNHHPNWHHRAEIGRVIQSMWPCPPILLPDIGLKGWKSRTTPSSWNVCNNIHVDDEMIEVARTAKFLAQLCMKECNNSSQ